MAVETITSGDLAHVMPLLERRMAGAWPKGRDEFRDELHTSYLRILRESPPLSITVAWPAGIPEDVKATLRAQLAEGLTDAATTRLIASTVQLAQAGAAALNAAQRLAEAAARAAK